MNKPMLLLEGVLLLFSSTVYAQEPQDRRIIDLKALPDVGVGAPLEHQSRPDVVPSWRDLNPPESAAMVFAVDRAALGPGLKSWLGRTLDALEVEVLLSAKADFMRAGSQSKQQLDQVCRRVLLGDFVERSSAVELGRLVNLADKTEEEFIKLKFQNVIDRLPSEVGEALVQLKDDILRNSLSSNSMNWEKYAEERPSEMLDKISRICSNSGAPSDA